MKEYFPDDEERREASAMQFNGRTEGEEKDIQIFSLFPPFCFSGTQSPGVFIIIWFKIWLSYSLFFFSVNNNQRKKEYHKREVYLRLGICRV